MRSGDLKNRIVLEAPSRAPDLMGGSEITWTAIDTVYAAIWPVRGDEAVAGAKPAASATHRVRIRYRRRMSPEWRIRYKDKRFSIVSIINPGMNYRALDLMCKEAI
jgi:SPP1 family predicted phage head-tail adaptor